MFYTKYRPQKFGELIGNEHVVSSITGALFRDKVGHAFFFSGSRGTGKTTTARLLAKALNCEKPIKSKDSLIKYEPCGKCKSCVSVKLGNHLDVIEVDAASNRGIDNIRELREGIKLSPSQSKYKIYIVDEVHMLTTEASNALLKTLEEPPSHAYFVLCTTSPEKVLETIRSRCQQFQFNRPSIDHIVSKLEKIVKEEKLDVSSDKLNRIAIIAKGAFREAETLLEQFIHSEVGLDQLLSEETDYYKFLTLLINNDRADAIRFVHKVYKSGANLEVWTEKLIEYVRSLLLEKLGIKEVDHTRALSNIEIDLVRNISLDCIKSVIQRLNNAVLEFKTTVVPTLPLEIAIIEFSNEEGKIRERSRNDNNGNDDGQKSRGVVSSVDNLKKGDLPSEKNLSAKSKKKPVKNIKFPYSILIEAVKPRNHSIHLLLNSCELESFDGKVLTLSTVYSFHKDRVMSHKVREILEKESSKIIGRQVIVNCKLSKKRPKAKVLTDQNVVLSDSKEDITQAFERVFGDSIER